MLLASGSHLQEILSEVKGASCEMCFLVVAGPFPPVSCHCLRGPKGNGERKKKNVCLVHKLEKNAYKYVPYFSLFGGYYMAVVTKMTRLLRKQRLK